MSINVNWRKGKYSQYPIGLLLCNAFVLLKSEYLARRALYNIAQCFCSFKFRGTEESRKYRWLVVLCLIQLRCLCQGVSAKSEKPLLETLSVCKSMVKCGTQYYTIIQAGRNCVMYQMQLASINSYRTTGIYFLPTVSRQFKYRSVTCDKRYMYIAGRQSVDSGFNTIIYLVKREDIENVEPSYTAKLCFADSIVVSKTPNDLAAIVSQGNWLHLFNNGTGNNHCLHYIVPCNPGTRRPIFLDSIKTNGVAISSAFFYDSDRLLLFGQKKSPPSRAFYLFDIACYYNQCYYLFPHYKRSVCIGSGQGLTVFFSGNIFFTGSASPTTVGSSSKPEQLVMKREDLNYLLESGPVTGIRFYENPSRGMQRFNYFNGRIEAYSGNEWAFSTK